ncbi:MAG: SDR family NAD(P)-dependent oxidoreductase, partial [Thaumarchaeota archaeon]|nr:SDR family NAD(P)-dependent oxidoreductase [Nitrososphaerota archaeon]
MLKGKVAAVTGASSGIGRATALALARAGARVLAGARRTDRLEALASEIGAAGGEALARPLDVTD